MIPSLPKPLPIGEEEPRAIAESLRDVLAYLAESPTVERVTWQGVADFPLELTVTTRRPFFVAFCGRPFPDSNTPTVEVLGLTYRWEANPAGATIYIDSIDGVAAGDSVTLSGVVVGERG